MIELTTGWTKLWGIISSTAPAFFTTLAVIGVALIVASFVMWVWQRRRGGGNNKNLGWTLAMGAVLAGPQFVIPLVLRAFELVINTVIALVKSLGFAG